MLQLCELETGYNNTTNNNNTMDRIYNYMNDNYSPRCCCRCCCCHCNTVYKRQLFVGTIALRLFQFSSPVYERTEHTVQKKTLAAKSRCTQKGKTQMKEKFQLYPTAIVIKQLEYMQVCHTLKHYSHSLNNSTHTNTHKTLPKMAPKKITNFNNRKTKINH